jgi:ribosomal protein S18 acetylase RimI-like enzyme
VSIEIKVLARADAALLQRVADEVFDNPVDPKLTAEFLADPRHALCVAVDDGTIVGFASGVRYVHPDKPSEFWVNEVAIAPTHQRRGLGKAIMTELLAFARREGCGEAWVLTDEDNGPARALYAAVGGEESLGVVMVTFPL